MNQTLSPFFRVLQTLIVYTLASLIVSTIFYSDMLRRMATDTPEKIGMPLLGPRTDLGDNYVYYYYAKAGLKVCGIGPQDIVDKPIRNTIACTYPAGLLVSHALYEVAKTFSPSLRWEPALTLILHTALLTFALLLALEGICGHRLSFSASLAISGFLLFVLGNFALSFYLGYPYKYFGAFYAGEPEITRIMNPTVFWALGLLALRTLLHAVKKPTPLTLLASGLCAILLGTASIAVAATLLAGLGLFLIFEWFAGRGVCIPALINAIVLLAGLAGMMLMFKIYWTSEVGVALNHGQFSHVVIKPAFLILLLPILMGRIYANDHTIDRLLKSLLIAAMMVGMLCDSVELGGRIWLRGAVIFALIYCAIWLWSTAKWITRLLWPNIGAQLSRSARMFCVLRIGTAILAPLVLFGVLQMARPWHPDSWRGYMTGDRYQALTWIGARTNERNVVASPDIDDSYVIPFYTKAASLVPLYGLGENLNDGLERYFYTLSLLQDGDAYITRILQTEESAIEAHFRFLGGIVKEPYDYYEFQKVAFYESLLYYPYNQQFKNALKNSQERQQLASRLGQIAENGTKRDFRFSYLLLRNDEILKDPLRFKEVFRNKSYIVFEPVIKKD
jgi:hypothetical protein